MRFSAPGPAPNPSRTHRVGIGVRERVRGLSRAIGLALALGIAIPTAQAADVASDAAVSAVMVERLLDAGIPEEPLRHALAAFSCARSRGLFTDPTLTLIDYSRPSTRRRLWVVDAMRGTVRFHELVAHGRESGEDRARRFSNEEGSHQSSLGLFRTAETYYGAHGYSLRLDGLEPGVNDRALERALVIHGADYVTPAFAARHGRLGRSWGCPAVDPAVHRELIDAIRGGTAVFAYYPDSTWLEASSFQSCETLTASR